MEAAAVSDPAHIAQGAAGPHVAKIQEALMRLDDVRIDVPELNMARFGPSTADAVLAFKRKRNIVNRAYQSQPDNIVGKMTMAAMDEELAKQERTTGPLSLRVISPAPERLDHRPHVYSNPVRNSFAGSALGPVLFSPALFAAPSFLPGPIVSINKGQTAQVEVRNGAGARISSGDPKIASVRDPASPGATLARITSNPQIVEIVGNHRGGAVIVVEYRVAERSRGTVTVSVKEARSTVYTPTMKPHDHRPTGRWKELLKAIPQPDDTDEGKVLAGLCFAGADPMTFVTGAIASQFQNKPIALKHLLWYLSDGRGQELNEDENIEKWVRSDRHIREKVARFITANVQRGPRFSGFFPFVQEEFFDQDFRFAFGTIDRLDIEVDFVLKTVKLWFMDSYEWHPVCAGFYNQEPDDKVRVTNSLHAALVELKSQGAADYWMVGEATLPLSWFVPS